MKLRDNVIEIYENMILISFFYESTNFEIMYTCKCLRIYVLSEKKMRKKLCKIKHKYIMNQGYNKSILIVNYFYNC